MRGRRDVDFAPVGWFAAGAFDRPAGCRRTRPPARTEEVQAPALAPSDFSSALRLRHDVASDRTPAHVHVAGAILRVRPPDLDPASELACDVQHRAARRVANDNTARTGAFVDVCRRSGDRKGRALCGEPRGDETHRNGDGRSMTNHEIPPAVEPATRGTSLTYGPARLKGSRHRITNTAPG